MEEACWQVSNKLGPRNQEKYCFNSQHQSETLIDIKFNKLWFYFDYEYVRVQLELVSSVLSILFIYLEFQ